MGALCCLGAQKRQMRTNVSSTSQRAALAKDGAAGDGPERSEGCAQRAHNLTASATCKARPPENPGRFRMMIRMAREADFRLITVVEPVLARVHL